MIDAIWLVFHERSAVPIHTLVAAAHQILDDLAQKEGMSTIKSLPYIREDMKKDWRAVFNRAQNFFKHADHDPEANLDFHPELPHFSSSMLFKFTRRSSKSSYFLKPIYIWLGSFISIGVFRISGRN